MTTYNPLYGGNTIQPSWVSYMEYANQSADLTFVWPFAYVNNPNVVASVMDISTTVNGLNFLMPDATQASVGQMTMIRNTGSHLFNVQDNNGNTICTVDPSPMVPTTNPGNMKYLYLVDNSTAAGVWRFVNFGTGAAQIDPTILAGYGLEASGFTLQTETPIFGINSDITIDPTYRASLVVTSQPLTITLPNPVLETGFQFAVLNLAGTGNLVTINPNGNALNGASSSITIHPDGSGVIVSNGTSWYAYGRSFSSFEAPLSVELGGTGQSTAIPIFGRLYCPVVKQSNTSIGPSHFWSLAELDSNHTVDYEVVLPVEGAGLTSFSWNPYSDLITDSFRINGTLALFCSEKDPEFITIQVLVNNDLRYTQRVVSSIDANILYVPLDVQVTLGGNEQVTEVNVDIFKSAGMTNAYLSPYVSGSIQTISTLLGSRYTGGS